MSCDPCTTDITVGQPTCAQMLTESVAAYNAVRRGLLTGKAAIEVQFGEQRVKYDATQATAKYLLDEITRLHRACPSTTSAAILGLGGGGGPISTSYGPCQ